MSEALFTKRFKVGDKIRSVQWPKSTPYTITAIGKAAFLCVHVEEQIDYIHTFDEQEWIKVEPEKLPSEEIHNLVYPNYNHTAGLGAIHFPSAYTTAIVKWLDENWPLVVKK